MDESFFSEIFIYYIYIYVFTKTSVGRKLLQATKKHCSFEEKAVETGVGKMFNTCTLFLGIFFCECFADFTHAERPK